MTWHERHTSLKRADPAREVLVVLYRLQGAPEVFALEEGQDTGEYVRLTIYEEEPVEQVREHDTKETDDRAVRRIVARTPREEGTEALRRLGHGLQQVSHAFEQVRAELHALEEENASLRAENAQLRRELDGMYEKIAALLTLTQEIPSA
jgi:predicted RNase H-like nuclease (RuvC/YqgF family)